MNKVKKKLILILIGLLTVISCIVVIIKFPAIQGKLSSNDHIKLKIRLLFDGKIVEVENKYITCVYETGEVCTVNGNEEIYSVKGGRYGQYKFQISVPGESLQGYDEDVIIHLNYMNANDWYISDSDCTIALSKQNGGLYGTVNINTKYNDGNSIVYDDTQVLQDNTLEINWGF